MIKNLQEQIKELKGRIGNAELQAEKSAKREDMLTESLEVL